ncbi:MAG: hypothetical protein IPP71_05280 [Bacteroidetes bacterium]|nr:hypothetical protein [Bacteroidota bacterium]
MKTIKIYFKNILQATALILFFGILSPIQTNASHFVGGEIYYKWVSGNTYNVSASLYRDCSGIPAPTTIDLNYNSISCSGNGTITLNLIGLPVQISPICAASLPNSTCNGGTLYGVEQNFYEGTVTLPFNCNDWQFSYNTCCRNGAITNLTNGAAYGTYISSMLNNLDVPFNNSVQFGNIPLNIINNISTTQLSWNAFDVDGDSLIYELTPARDFNGSVPVVLTYTPGITYQQPFSSLLPTTLNFANGLLEVTPNAAQVAVVCMKVSEYRNGFFIGEVNRDFQIVVENSSNNSPTLSGINGTNSFITNGCPGDTITFDVISNDIDAGQNVTLSPNITGTTATWTSAGTPFPVGTFQWIPTPADISSQPYTYTLNVNDDHCDYYGTQTYIYQVYINGCNTNDVWPGDANSDGTANLYDLLAVGIAYNDIGPVRPSANTTWVAQPCPDWTNSFTSGINYKHADTDGNGTVDLNDTTAIMLNYGLNHPLRNMAPAIATVADLTVTANFDTVGTMMAVDFDVAISSPVDSLYGLAFRLYFDQSLVDITTVAVTYPGSVFGTNGVDMVKVDRSAGLNGFVDIALSRINQQNISGTGPVAKVTIVTTDNVSGKMTLNVTPSDVIGITYSQDVVNFNTLGDEVVIDPNFLGVNETLLSQLVTIYPSPATDFVEFNYSGSEFVKTLP